MTPPSGQPKCQIVKAIHVEVTKEFEDIATNLLHKALRSTAFWHATNLIIKVVPLLTDHMPLVNQNLLCCTITKQALCVSEYEYVGNPHIDLMDELSPILKNNSLHSLVLAYCHKKCSSPWTKTTPPPGHHHLPMEILGGCQWSGASLGIWITRMASQPSVG